MKRCYKCKEKKNSDQFYKDKNHKDGLDSKCKSCRDIYYKEYSKKNREKISKRQLEWWRKKHATS